MNASFFTLNLATPEMTDMDTVSKSIRENAHITSNWQYRRYMQQHAKDIMKTDTMGYIQATGNNPYATNQVSLPPPDSDLKRSYLANRQRQARMIAPSIPTTSFHL